MGSQSAVSLGALKPSSNWGGYNEIIFAVQQAISKLQTATLVRVEACTNAGALSPVGNVDVTPLVNQIDADGNPTPHVTVYGLPYLRLQGGTDAVIIDPKPGDIGIAVFASRDISKVKSTRKQANPGSFRTYDFADGLYVGGILNGAPQQYVRFSAAGVEIVSPSVITLRAPNITLDGTVTVDGALTQSGGDVSITAPHLALAATAADATMSGNLSVSGDVMAQGTSLHTHTHTSTTPGTPTSPPL